MSLPSPPGQQWVDMLEWLYVLSPHFVNRQYDLKYWVPVVVTTILSVFPSLIFLFGGTFSPQFGLAIGNGMNLHGIAGQLMSFGTGVMVLFITVCQVRMLMEKTLPFISDIVAYDDPKRNPVVLTGDYGQRMIKVLSKSLFILKWVSRFHVTNVFVMITFLFLVYPIYTLGITIGNVALWTFTLSHAYIPSFYIPIRWLWIFGSWFICKSHLEIQADVIIDMMDHLLKSKIPLKTSKIFYLEFRYHRLISQVKQFDGLSVDLISPYRAVISYVCVIVMFGVHQQDNVMLKVVLDVPFGTLYIGSLVFLSTACTLSTQRKKMYLMANELYIKNVRQQSGGHIGQRVILRRLVKSLGNGKKPTICLTVKSGHEFQPMEFVGFVLETFAQFALASTLYHNYIK